MFEFSGMGAPSHSGMMRQIMDQAETMIQTAEEDLKAIGSRYSLAGLFTASVALMIASRGEVSEAAHGDIPSNLEKLAYYLWRCPRGTEPPSIEAVRTVIRSIEQIGRAFPWRSTIPSSGEQSPDMARLLSHLAADVEVIRGSAYPEQIDDQITEVAGRHVGDVFGGRCSLGRLAKGA